MIDRLAQAFGKLPSEILSEQFDNVMPFLAYWRDKDDFVTRFQRLKNDTTSNRPGS